MSSEKAVYGIIRCALMGAYLRYKISAINIIYPKWFKAFQLVTIAIYYAHAEYRAGSHW